MSTKAKQTEKTLRQVFQDYAKGKSIDTVTDEFMENASLLWETQAGNKKMQVKNAQAGLKNAKEQLISAKMNAGKALDLSESEQETYINNVVAAQNKVVEAENKLKKAEETCKFYVELAEEFSEV